MKSKPHLPASVFKELRASLPLTSYLFRRTRTQEVTAKLLGTTKRSVARWELEGGAHIYGWAYVGVAFRLGREPAAQRTLKVLAKQGFEGSDVWGRDDR